MALDRTAPASAGKVCVLRTFTYTDPRSGLEVVCDVKGYPEFRAVEWVLHFRNTSAENSGQLTRVKVADFDMVYPAAGALKIHYAEGNKISKADYAPRTAEFRTEQPLHIEPHGGRSSEEAFPLLQPRIRGFAAGRDGRRRLDRNVVRRPREA